MKRLKRIMALVIAMVMVVAMSLPAMAEDTTGAPTSGSITVNSPIVGATYKVYKVFDMTTNADVNAFSYTINENSPFYGAVVTYASDKTKGLQLTRIQGSSPATYNVAASTADSTIEGYGTFDAQAFGKAMQGYLTTGSPAVTADDAETAKAGTGIVAKAAGSAIAENYSKVCTITDENTSDTLVFDGVDDNNDGTNDGIPLGYYLINPSYPAATAKTVTMTVPDSDPEKTYSFTVAEDLDGDGNLNDTATGKITNYVNETVTEAYVAKYCQDNGITTKKDGSPLGDAAAAFAEYGADIKATMTTDATNKVKYELSKASASEADHNVKEPILVFLDSSKPDAVINEKNELDKWDVPVNPDGTAKPGTPEHGEPEGGKNIVAGETTNGDAIFADWSDAEIGESVHYQLRVNAMNFIRTGNTDATIEQVKEYILADFQSAHMHFDDSKGLHVSIWQGNNNNDSQTDEVNVTSNVGVGTGTGIANATYEATGTVGGVTYPSINYTTYATGDPNIFFKNGTENDGTAATTTDIFGTTETGIVVPWVFVFDPSTVADETERETQLNTYKSQYPIYTITNVGTGEYETEDIKQENGNNVSYKVEDKDQEGNSLGTWTAVPGQFVSVNGHVVNAQGQLLDKEGNPIQKTKPVYTFNIYNSDVTIVVDYWMILDDDAIVDEPGNKNFAQYGWNPVKNEDDNHNPIVPDGPSETDKPSQKEEVDEATVYTYALAWVKIDEQGNELADAEFELPFYVKKDKKDGKSYIYAMTKDEYDNLEAADKATKYTNKVTTTTAAADGEKGVITIKGVEQGKYKITETEAPVGYNKLTEPFEIEAKKSGDGITTTTKTTIYYDAQGNVTDTITNVTKEYKTDEDTYNKATPSVAGEETSVPVYQYKHITNKQGTELPSTGGIGTTIFYVIGTILVLGAGVVLITRRRMDA